MLFLFFGDIMFLYGICGIILGLLMGLSNKVLTILAWIALTVNAVLSLLFLVFTIAMPDVGLDGSDMTELVNGGAIETSYLDMLAANLEALTMSITTLPLQLFLYLPVMMIGFVWARKGVLDDVDAHRPCLFGGSWWLWSWLSVSASLWGWQRLVFFQPDSTWPSW